MDKAECGMCNRQRSVFYCKHCTSDLLQHRRTMVAALQADVAVLRKKTETALQARSSVIQAERRLFDCMKQVETLTERVMHTREQLCNERIAVMEMASAFEERSVQLVIAQEKLVSHRQNPSTVHSPVLQCLDLQVEYAQQSASKARADKIRELFALFGVVNTTDRSFFRSITSLPLPISGRFEIVPPEVVSAALGKVIHLLLCLIKYIKITYPHPMVFNGSFSTIGNTSEGAGCHTLYPDGSVGFERGLAMLHENIAFLCAMQGIATSALSATDLLGNLLLLLEAPALGKLCDNTSSRQDDRHALESSLLRQSTLGKSALLLENSQSLDASVEILPHYS